MTYSLLNLLLWQDPQPAGSAGSSVIMILIVLAVMYFFMIRPQQRKQKEQNTFSDSVTVGRKVITSGGIRGEVTSIEDMFVEIEVSKGIRMKVLKNSISLEYSKLVDESIAEKKS